MLQLGRFAKASGQARKTWVLLASTLCAIAATWGFFYLWNANRTGLPGELSTDPSSAQSPEALVQALRELPAGIPGGGPGNAELPPVERHRLEIYDRLWSLGAAAMPALCRGLGDRDVRVRRNAALFLSAAGGDWYQRERPRLAITECVPALVNALTDSDGRVRELAAQAVGVTGTSGVAAVPGLVGMLSSPSEGDRNTACIGLAGIGPPAQEALLALTRSLSDPSPDVRANAKRAIERIER